MVSPVLAFISAAWSCQRNLQGHPCGGDNTPHRQCARQGFPICTACNNDLSTHRDLYEPQRIENCSTERDGRWRQWMSCLCIHYDTGGLYNGLYPGHANLRSFRSAYRWAMRSRRESNSGSVHSSNRPATTYIFSLSSHDGFFHRLTEATTLFCEERDGMRVPIIRDRGHRSRIQFQPPLRTSVA